MTTGRFGALLGAPLAFWGLAGYWAMLVLAGTRWLLPLAALAAAAAIALAAISAFALRALCPLCAATWAVDLAVLALAWRGRRGAVAPSRRRLALAGGVALAILVAGRLADPPGAALSAWRGGLGLPHGVDADGHAWLGAERPTLVVEEIVDYRCPHCRRAHARLRGAVAARGDGVRLVRHDWARMPCLPVPDRPAAATRCDLARVGLCAGDQGRFWEASDWLFSHPPRKLDLDAIARGAGLDAQRLRACVAEPRTFARAHREHEHARAARARGTPAFVVGGERLTLDETLRLIRDAP